LRRNPAPKTASRFGFGAMFGNSRNECQAIFFSAA